MPPAQLADVAVMITVLAMIDLVCRVTGPASHREAERRRRQASTESCSPPADFNSVEPQPPGSGTPPSSTDDSARVG
jgi:hypothetical protein